MNYIVGLIGMWIFCDAWFSLSLYIGRADQKWLKDHSIRVIRLLSGIALIVIGGING